MVFPFIWFLGMCGTALAEAGLLLNYTVTVTNAQDQNYDTQVRASTASALSLATNASCVFLVAYRLWSHCLLFHPVVIGRSRAQKMLSLLIESGTVYCGLKVINLIFTSLTIQSNTSFRILVAILIEFYRQVTGMYPTLVWLLVHQNRSVIESYSFVVQPSLKPEVDPVQNVSPRRSLLTNDV